MLKAGVPEGQMTHEFAGRTLYGRRSFPRYVWVARLGYVDALEQNASSKASALAEQWAQKGLRTNVRYHAAD